MFSREHAVQLHRARDEFAEAGARLVAIGQDSPESAARFRESRGLEGLTVLVDRDRAAYRAAGAKKATFTELLGPKQIVTALTRARKMGVRQGRTVGHPAQLGGVLVVRPDGEVTYAHLADSASDNAPVEEILEAAREAAGAEAARG